MFWRNDREAIVRLVRPVRSTSKDEADQNRWPRTDYSRRSGVWYRRTRNYGDESASARARARILGSAGARACFFRRLAEKFFPQRLGIARARSVRAGLAFAREARALPGVGGRPCDGNWNSGAGGANSWRSTRDRDRPRSDGNFDRKRKRSPEQNRE